jgi:hypothetical protein
MNIRFTSSLTPEDENMIAPVILRALASILSVLPIAYNVRIDTSDSKVYQFSGSGTASAGDLDLPGAQSATDRWRYQPDVS